MNSRSFYFCLSSSGITGVHHHAQLLNFMSFFFFFFLECERVCVRFSVYVCVYTYMPLCVCTFVQMYLNAHAGTAAKCV